MIPAGDVRIELPRWVAGFSYDLSERATASGATRIGPFDVLCPDAGLDAYQFGNPARQSVALFDGFFLEHASLCEQLGLPVSAGGAELTAAAYLAWGMDCLSRLTGCYLIAVFDADDRRLLLGHDQLGRHPVFYAAGPRTLWFGPNVLALAGSSVVSARPNRLALALAGMTLWPASGETFFAEISRLRPGHYLDVSHGRPALERKYWDPLPRSESDWLSEREVLQAFEPSLSRAVERCLALVPDGIMLSGGVDSVTVAALGTRYRQSRGQRPLVAFSGRPDEPMLQEEHMQARAAEALGLPHIVTRTSEWTHQRNDIDVSLEATPDLPGPSRIYWVGTYMGFYRAAVANGLRVLLTGSGGDNWLAVADLHAADLLRGGRVVELSRFIRAAARTGGSSYRAALRRLLWMGGAKPLIDSFAARALPARKARFHRERAEVIVPRWLCPDASLRRELIDHLMSRRTPSLTPGGRFPSNYYQHSLANASNPHLYHEFETAFHVEATCGVRLLSPYHDCELVQFFTRIPPPVLVHGNKYKGLLRPVVERLLPGLGFGQQRKDYPQRALDLDLRNLREGVQRAWPLYSFPRLRDLGLLHSSALDEEARNARAHALPALVRMFALMSAESWTALRTS